MAQNKLTRAEAALERVRAAGRRGRQEAKQRTGAIVGSVATGALGWAEATGKWNGKVGPVHVSLIGLPMAFATLVSKGAVARQLEMAAGPLLGVATYRLGRGETVVGDEYSGVAGEYGNYGS